MAIRVVVQFRARPGRRAELRELLESLSATHGRAAPGFLGSTVHEALDHDDELVEIAEWESAEAQADAVQRAIATGVYDPVVELVATPFTATRIR